MTDYKMSFQFPFPSLKNLSMIRISRAVLEKGTRTMLKYERYLDTLGEEEVEDEDIENDYIDVENYRFIWVDDFVPHLVQIFELRHDLSDVFRGMQHQTRNIVSQFSQAKKANDVALIFDVHGRLDVLAAWRYYFEDQLNNVKSVKPAVDLLDFALQRRMWCEIGAIIAKIMSLVGRDPDSLPEPELILDNHNKYTLAYGLNDLLYKPSANVRSRLSRIIQEHRCVIGDDKDRLLIPLDKLCENYMFIRKFFITMDTNEKESFIEQIIPRLRHRFRTDNFLSEIITDLDDEMLRHFMVKVLEGEPFGYSNRVNLARGILNKMLRWPFTQFFMPLLELLAPFLAAYDYAELFKAIVMQVPDECFLGNLDSNLLLKFCQAIPSNVKQELSQRFKKDMTKWLEYLRSMNTQLGDRIGQILLPQVE